MPGLNRVPEKQWTKVHNIVQQAVTKTIPKKKKFRKAKWLSQEVLQIAEKKRKRKGKNTEIKKRRERQRRKGKIYPSECRVPENIKER